VAGVAKTPLRLQRLVGLPNEAREQEIEEGIASGKLDPGTVAGGDFLASMPVGGAASKAVGTAVKALPRAVQAVAGSRAAVRARAAGRGLTGAVARGAAEGGAAGAVTTDDAGTGAGIGAGLGLIPGAAKLGSTGLVKATAGAKEVERKVRELAGHDIFIPLPQKIKETGLLSKSLGSAYRQIMPYVPFAGRALKGQADEAAEAVRLRQLQDPAHAAQMGILKPGSAAPGKVEKTLDKMHKGLTGQFDETLNKYVFRVDGDADSLANRVQARLKDTSAGNRPVAEVEGYHPDVMKEVGRLVEKHQTKVDGEGTGTITGRALLEIKNRLWGLADEALEKGKNGALSAAYSQAAKAVDDAVEADMYRPEMAKYMDEVGQGGKSKGKFKPTQKELENWINMEQYRTARKAWGQYRAMDQAKAMATLEGKQGAFDPVRHLEQTTGGHVVGSPVEEQIQLGRAAAPHKVAEPSTPARWAARAALGTGLVTAAPLTVPLVGGARLMASKKGQQALFGELGSQKRLAEHLRKYGKQDEELERLIRTGLIVEGRE
jgi:hypothetical protein